MNTLLSTLTQLSEKWLRHGFNATKLLQRFFEGLIGIVAVITASFMLSLVSAADAFIDHPA